jgi:hypothetical protein
MALWFNKPSIIYLEKNGTSKPKGHRLSIYRRMEQVNQGAIDYLFREEWNK